MSGNDFTIDIGKHEQIRVTGGGHRTGELCMLKGSAGGTLPEHGRLVVASVDHIIEPSKMDKLKQTITIQYLLAHFAHPQV